jgi:putative NADH-flavin reductase
MKSVIVFGASGLLGNEVVNEILRTGAKVIVYTRQSHFPNSNVSVVCGELTDEAKIAKASDGIDVVVCCVGNRNYEDPTKIVSPFVNLVVKLIQPNQRLIVVAGSGLTLADARTLRRNLPGQPEFLKNQREDHWEAYCALSPLDIDYLVVCPTMMVEGSADDNYTVEATYFPKDAAKEVFAGNVARFIAKEIMAEKYQKVRVGIANKITS